MSRETGADPCRLLHVDMDAFYASVAVRARPELAGLPVIVGGGHRGVVLAASYAARARGVRSGMSGAEARRRCPEAVCVRPDFPVILATSRAIMATLRTFSPEVEVASLDEAYLDVGGVRRLHGTPLEIAAALRERIASEHALTCSVGIAASCPAAKLASRLAKPDGVVRLPPEEFAARVGGLDVGVLHGLGPATRERLARLGVRTVADLAGSPREVLEPAVGQRAAAWLRELAAGRGRDRLAPAGAGFFGLGEGDPERSAGAQRTFAADLSTEPDGRAELHRELLALAEGVCRRVRRMGREGLVVAVDVRFDDFSSRQRQRRLPRPTARTGEVHDVATDLLDSLLDSLLDTLPAAHVHAGLSGSPGVRRLGVRLGDLREPRGFERQRTLDEPELGWGQVESVADRAVARFGRDALVPASLLRAGRSQAGERDRPPGWPDQAIAADRSARFGDDSVTISD